MKTRHFKNTEGEKMIENSLELSDNERKTLKTLLENEKFKLEDFLRFPKWFHFPIHGKKSIMNAENRLKDVNTILNRLNQ